MHVEVHEIQPDREYAVAHQLGPGYCGPGGGFLFWEGVVPVPVPGHQARLNGLPAVASYFEYVEGFEFSWDGAWYYGPAEREEAPEPAPEPKKLVAEPRDTTPPEKARCAAKTASGKPCKRYRKAASEFCGAHSK